MPLTTPAFLKAAVNFASAVGGSAIAHAIFVEGKKENGLKPEVIRNIAPDFALNRADEAKFAQVKLALDPNQQTAVENVSASLGRHQRADFILTIAQMTVTATLEEAVKYLRRVADQPAIDEAIVMLVADQFIKPKEADYPIYTLEQLKGGAIKTVVELGELLWKAPTNAIKLVVKAKAQVRDQIAKLDSALGATALGQPNHPLADRAKTTLWELAQPEGFGRGLKKYPWQK